MSPAPLRHWVQERLRLDEAGFVQKYPCPFLLLLERLDAAPGKQDTDVGFMTLKAGDLQAMRADPLDLLVFPVSKRQGSNAFGMMITVGRAKNNDLVIESGTISKFHCYFEQRGEQWFLKDPGSSNGTSLAEQRLEKNEAQEVQDNTIVSFSSIRARFLLPDSMLKLLAREARRLKA